MLKYALCLLIVAFGVECKANEFAVEKLTETEQHMVDQINAYRARSGQAPLTVNVQVLEATRRHAFWMAANRIMMHPANSGRENIAMGQDTVAKCVSTWINSGPHRTNLLSRGSYIGVAAYRSTWTGRIYWCYRIW